MSAQTPSSTSGHSSSRGSTLWQSDVSAQATTCSRKLTDGLLRRIGDQVYHFSADDIARMLSPKSAKDKRSTERHPLLSSFGCLIDHRVVARTLQGLVAPHFADACSNSESENDFHDALLEFLNVCATSAKQAYETIQEEINDEEIVAKDGYWKNLNFVKYNKETKDSMQGAPPMTPAIVGILTQPPQDIDQFYCYWSLPAGTPGDEIAVACVVEDSWREAIAQAAVYALAGISASPWRAFSLVIAANYTTRELRYLLFHHGGLSASKPLCLTEVDDRRDIQKIMLSVLLWQNPADAGLPPFTNGREFRLPIVKGQDAARVFLGREIDHVLSVRGRGTWVGAVQLGSAEAARALGNFTDRAMDSGTSMMSAPLASNALPTQTHAPPGAVPLEATTFVDTKVFHDQEPTWTPTNTTYPACGEFDSSGNYIMKCAWPEDLRHDAETRVYAASSGGFGVPRLIVSFTPVYGDGFPMSNSIFLPSDGVLSEHFWDVLGTDVPTRTDKRALQVTVLADEGEELTECDSPWDLCECLLHAALGWLVMYMQGYLHRDVSIGNVLKLKKPLLCDSSPSGCRPFSALGVKHLLKKMIELSAADTAAASVETATDELSKVGAEDLWPAVYALAEKIPHPKAKELVDAARALQDSLERYGVPTECKAIITDGDMAAYTPMYFSPENQHRGTLSGTLEFMSRTSLDAAEDKQPYIQTPVDDMWSFFHTTVWAVAYGRDQKDTWEENRLRTHIRGYRRDTTTIQALRNSRFLQEEYSDTLLTLRPFLLTWYNSLFANDVDERSQTISRSPQPRDAMSALLECHLLAFQGITALVNAMYEHRGEIKKGVKA